MDQPPRDEQTLAKRTAPPVIPAGRRPGVMACFLCVVLGVLVADLGLKTYAFRTVAGEPITLDPSAPPYFGVPHHDPVTLIPGILNLQLTANSGAIFGIGKGSRWIFVLVSLLAVVVVGRVFLKSDARLWLFHTALALILAGALGNLYDRVVHGVVRDMLHLFPNAELPWNLTWPGGARGLYPWIFNLADVSLLVGVVLVIFVTWRHAPPKQAAETSRD